MNEEEAKRKIKEDQENAKKEEGHDNAPQIPSEAEWQLKDDIIKELSSHDFFISHYEPIKFVIAHKGFKQIVNAYAGKINKIVLDVDGKPVYSDGEPVTEVVPKLRFGKPIINAIPLTVTKYDSSMRVESKYGITFLTNTAKQITTQIDTIEGITIELREKGLLMKIREAEEALAGILNSMEQIGHVNITNETENPGFYLVGEKLIACGIHSRVPAIVEIKECIELLEELVLYKYDNKVILPTVIKWSMVAPFDYAMKSHYNWMKWLHLFGFTTAAKTTMGRIGLAIWRSNDGNQEFSFQNMNTSARLGQVLSQSTFPILINEVGGLNDEKYIDIVEMIKNATESKNARGKFTHKNRYNNIPALSACILTGNFPPPFDAAYNRKVLPIYFSQNDKHTDEKESDEFTRWLQGNLHILGTLGDFTRNYVFGKPEVLQKSWNEIGIEILSEFYASAGFEIPQWSYAFVEQTQITDTIEQNFLVLRGYLVRLINDSYNRYSRNLGDDIGMETDLLYKLDFCCKFQLLPFIHHNKNSDVYCITSDIMRELKNGKLDHTVASLKGLADILKFEYGTQRICNVPMKVAYVHRTDLRKLLEIEVEVENISTRLKNV